MPIYSFRNKITGKVWDEYLSLQDRTKQLRNHKIEMVITDPNISFMKNTERKGRDKVIDAKRNKMKERQIEEQVGIRK